ncbi:MAG: hypothetical protein IJP44_06310 [Bacteroidales bacterium]|nr:hypothetical protein [Bacteroidales bacterium]
MEYHRIITGIGGFGDSLPQPSARGDGPLNRFLNLPKRLKRKIQPWPPSTA